MVYRLEAQETIPDGIRRILLEQVNQIILNLTDSEIDPDVGIHEARKTCKRMRAAYRMIRDEIGKPLYRQENFRFRDTARSLAGVRDSWVLIQTFDQWVNDFPSAVSGADAAKIRGKLWAEYQAVQAADQADPAKIALLIENMQDAVVQIEQLPLHRTDFLALYGGLRRVYRKGRQAMNLAAGDPTAENFHEWRKRVKYLWHQMEILELFWPQMLVPLGEELHRLSDDLGDEHDLAVLQQTLQAHPHWLSNPENQAALMQIIDQKRFSLQGAAYLLGLRLYTATPKSFTLQLAACYQAWKLEK